MTAIKNWAKIFTKPGKLAEEVAMKVFLHWGKVQTDFQTMGADWSANKYFKFGDDLGGLLTLILGVPEKEPTYQIGEVSASFDDVCNLVAGLIFGLVGDNYLPEI